jgi:PAS domain S-box-containing protein
LEGALNINGEGLIVYTNKAFENIISKSSNMLVGHKFEDFLDEKSKREFKKLFKQAFSGNSKGEIYISRGNLQVPVSISLTSLYPKYKGIGIIISDLTYKKKYEQEILSFKNFKEELKKKSRMMEHSADPADNLFQGVPI